MSQTGEIAGGRPLWQGKVLGIPVHLDASFVVVMAIFLWGTDKLLEFLLYDLILGWKQ